MEIVTCPYCESILLEHYEFGDGSEKCVCRHCGEWETRVFKVGEVVKHCDAAYSEDFKIVEVIDNKDGFDFMIQGPKPKYSEPFPVSKEKLFTV